MKFRLAIMALALCAFSGTLHAQYGQNQSPKWEVAPFVGFDTSGTFPVQNSASVDKFRANQNVSFGAFGDYSITDSFQAEVMWNLNPTSFDEHDVVTDSYMKAFDSTINQFQFGALYMFRGEDQKLRPYVAAGIGFTHDGNSGTNPSDTNLSFGVGGGVKYYMSHHWGFRGDARYVPTYANSSPATYCDQFGDCYSANQRNYLNRFNLTAGVIFRF
ncbi:MAG: outer membrane beta-barrel protein [Candidatus Acidiferrales bacterium]